MRKIIKELAGWLVYIVIVVIIAWGFVTFVAQRTQVSGASMETTLSDGDQLIVDKISYQFREPERFEIIVFPSFEKISKYRGPQYSGSGSRSRTPSYRPRGFSRRSVRFFEALRSFQSEAREGRKRSPSESSALAAGMKKTAVLPKGSDCGRGIGCSV